MAVSLSDLTLIYGEAGARDKFERLCSLLIASEYPGAKGIRVVRGDGGVDTSVGDWVAGSEVTVFQQKYFTKLDESQQGNIRESFGTARDNPNFKLGRWILCIPIDLSNDEQKWWDGWKAKQTVPIELWGKLRLENLLMAEKNKGIKEEFFKQTHLTQVREIYEKVVTQEAKLPLPDLDQILTSFTKVSYRQDQNIRQDMDGERVALSDIFIDLNVEGEILTLAATSEAKDEYAQYAAILVSSDKSRKLVMFTASALETLLLEREYQNSAPTVETKSASILPAKTRLLLVGGPGQGKSTLSQRVAQLHRTRWLDNSTLESHKINPELKEKLDRQPKRVVFRIILREYAQWLYEYCGQRTENSSVQKLFPALANYLLEKHFPPGVTSNPAQTTIEQILGAHPCYLILDGLDEVTNESLQTMMLTSIQTFIDRTDTLGTDLRVLITSRPLLGGFDNFLTFDLAGFVKLQIQSLDNKKSIEYANKWISEHDLDSTITTRILGMFEAAQRNPQTEALLSTPFQVSVILNIILEKEQLPTNQVQLFAYYWEILIKREEAKKPENSIFSIIENKELLFKLHCYIAYVIHRDAATAAGSAARLSTSEFRTHVKEFLASYDTSLSKEDVRKKVDRLITETHDRIFLITKPGKDYFAFEVRSLQEYFAGAYLIEGIELATSTSDSKLAETKAKEKRGKLLSLAQSSHWRRVLIFAIGALVSPNVGYEALRAFTLEICEELDAANKITQHLRPGAIFALELVEARVFDNTPNLEKDMLGYGLKVLESSIIFTRQPATRGLLQRLPYNLVNTLVKPVLEEKLEKLTIAYLSPLLEIYTTLFDLTKTSYFYEYEAEDDKEDANYIEWRRSQKLVEQKIKVLLAARNELSTVFDLATETQISVEWLGRILQKYASNPDSGSFEWWSTLVAFNSEIYQDSENYNGDEYVEQLIKAWQPTSFQAKELLKFLFKERYTFSSEIQDDIYGFFSPNYILPENSSDPQAIVLSFIACAFIIQAYTCTNSYSSTDLLDCPFFNVATKHVPEFWHERPPLKERVSVQAMRLVLGSSGLELYPELAAALWVIYWYIYEPVYMESELADITLFLTFLQRVSETFENKEERTTFLQSYLRPLNSIAHKWPLGTLAAQAMLENLTQPKSIGRLASYLTSKAQEQIQEQVIASLKEFFSKTAKESLHDFTVLYEAAEFSVSRQFFAREFPSLSSLAAEFGVSVPGLIESCFSARVNYQPSTKISRALFKKLQDWFTEYKEQGSSALLSLSVTQSVFQQIVDLTELEQLLKIVAFEEVDANEEEYSQLAGEILDKYFEQTLLVAEMNNPPVGGVVELYLHSYRKNLLATHKLVNQDLTLRLFQFLSKLNKIDKFFLDSGAHVLSEREDLATIASNFFREAPAILNLDEPAQIGAIIYGSYILEAFNLRNQRNDPKILPIFTFRQTELLPLMEKFLSYTLVDTAGNSLRLNRVKDAARSWLTYSELDLPKETLLGMLEETLGFVEETRFSHEKSKWLGYLTQCLEVFPAKQTLVTELIVTLLDTPHRYSTWTLNRLTGILQKIQSAKKTS